MRSPILLPALLAATVSLTGCGADPDPTAAAAVSNAAVPLATSLEEPAAASRPPADQPLEHGSLDVDGVTYLAMSRSCEQVSADGTERLRTFLVTDGATDRSLDVALTQHEDGTATLELGASGDAESVRSTTTTLQAADADLTHGVGTLDDGSDVQFYLATYGPPSC